MKKSIQVVSNYRGEIVGIGVPEISSSGGDVQPSGCAVLADEYERVDEVTLDAEMTKLSIHELHTQCKITLADISIKIEKA